VRVTTPAPVPSADASALAAALRATADAVAALPRSIEEELLERRGELPVEVIHGSEEQWSAWARYAASIRPRAPINLYPSLDVIRTLIVTEVDSAVEPYREDIRVRAILSADAVVTDADRDVVDRLVAAGMEVRLSAHVPSWLYADAGVLSALPLVWGEHPPSSIIVIRDPAISTALAALVEPLWSASEPYRAVAPEWADTLRLASLGLSDKAIATAQEVSHRTVQRRFAEAMEHYGVRSRFELGAAWRADQWNRLVNGDPAGIR
jgi:hypothetical protein